MVSLSRKNPEDLKGDPNPVRQCTVEAREEKYEACEIAKQQRHKLKLGERINGRPRTSKEKAFASRSSVYTSLRSTIRPLRESRPTVKILSTC